MQEKPLEVMITKTTLKILFFKKEDLIFIIESVISLYFNFI